MKKMFLALIVLGLSLVMMACQQLTYNAYVRDVNYDLYDVYFVGKNEVVTIDYELLDEAGYDYDQIVYEIEDEEVIKLNSSKDVKGKEPGKSLLKATLYKDSVPVTNVVFGMYINIDLEHDEFVEITDDDTFLSLLDNNPQGNFYLGSDIQFSTLIDHEPIDKFSGILINPFGYTISGLSGESALFESLDNAYIDGLIIDHFSFAGTYTGTLAQTIEDSYISNVHVTNTTLVGTNITGGIASQSINSVYVNVSFEGDITASQTVGGLLGTASNGEEEYSFYRENLLFQSYAYANIIQQNSSSHTAGLIGEIKHFGVIESCYTGGSIIGGIPHPVSYNVDNGKIYYLMVYAAFAVNDDIASEFRQYQLFEITNEALFTGTLLPGLEGFDFDEGHLPYN